MSHCPWHFFRRASCLTTLVPTSLASAANVSHLSVGPSCTSLQPPASHVCVRRSFATTSSAMIAQGYKEAIEALNGLQTNAALLQSIRAQGEDRSHTNIPATIKYLTRAGVTLEQLDSLSVIHVTGTKGKGSTCAFTERLLREHGCRTGLYTSPHLVSVTERIRLDGQPLRQDEYAKYFWQVYNSLYSQRDSPSDMPAYFKFLTVLALKVFVEEAVDVAVLEVGIGGEYDCTNVVRRPVVVGITSLDLDHTSLLGTSLASIAWHKAGIIKQGAALYTVPGHDSRALSVIQDRARHKQCEVRVVPSLHEYGWCRRPIHLGLAGEVQLLNASLALQLAHHWLGARQAGATGGGPPAAANGGPPAAANGAPTTIGTAANSEPDRGVTQASPFTLSEEDLVALREVVWPGRSQVLRPNSRFTFYLDGAHTTRSMEACSSWFESVSSMHGCQLQQRQQHHRSHQEQLQQPQQYQLLQHQQLLPRYQNHELQSHQQKLGQSHHDQEQQQQPVSPPRLCRVLLFNSTGDRDVQALLRSLLKCHFHLVVFTTNIANRDSASSSDQTNLTVSDQSQLLRCLKHLEAWQALRAKASAAGAPESIGTRVPAARSYTEVPTEESSTSADASALSSRMDSMTTSLLSESCKAYSEEERVSSELTGLANSDTVGGERTNISQNNGVNLLPTTDPLRPASYGSPAILDSQPLKAASSSSSPVSLSAATAQLGSLDVTHMLQLTPLTGHWSTDGSQGELDEDEDSVRAVVVPFIRDAIDWLNLSSRTTANEFVSEEMAERSEHEDTAAAAVVADTGHGPSVYQSRDYTSRGGKTCEKNVFQLLDQIGPLPQDLLEADHVQVLVTGSLHLVGGVLAVLDPTLSSSSSSSSKCSPSALARHHLHHRSSCTPGAP